jgi:hypothetical protein
VVTGTIPACVMRSSAAWEAIGLMSPEASIPASTGSAGSLDG